MLSGVSIVCFAASYGVALVLELTRLLFRSGVRGALLLGFAGAGMVAHTAFLYYRATSAIGSPLSSEQDWYLLAAWVLAGTYLYLTYYHPRTAFGLFVLPLVLALIVVAVFLADPEPFARESASRAWGIAHGISILLAVVSVLVGFVAGAMYFRQAWRLKHKRPAPRRLRLPSLEWLERANSRAIVVSTLLMGVGVFSGVLLKLINRADPTDSVPWTDPVVLSSLVMCGWLVLALAVGLVYKPARAGRKVAYLTLVSFVFLIAALGAGLLMDTQHGGSRERSLRDQLGTGPFCGQKMSSWQDRRPKTWTCPLSWRRKAWREGDSPIFAAKTLVLQGKSNAPRKSGQFPVNGQISTCPPSCHPMSAQGGMS